MARPISLKGVDQRLIDFVHRNGLVVTSARGGKHNVGSKHPLGEAVDVRSRGLTEEFIGHLIRDADAHGLRLRDERVRPPHQAVWGGPHLHVETR